jgi:tetratricopeptide (TPR) repeat protein
MNIEAEVHLLKSEYAEARNIHTQVIQRTSPHQDGYNHAYGLLHLAEIDVMTGTGQFELHQSLDKIKVMLKGLGEPRPMYHCELILANLNLREMDTISARTVFQQCLNSARKIDAQDVLYALERLGNTSRWPVADFSWASRWTVIYLAYANKIHNKLALHNALQFLGDVFLTQGYEDTAYSLFTVALDGFTFMDVHCSRAQCMLRLGDILDSRGDSGKAFELWKEAQKLFERSLQAKDVVEIDNRLAAVDHKIQKAHQEQLSKLRELDAPTRSLEQLVIGDLLNENLKDDGGCGERKPISLI